MIAIVLTTLLLSGTSALQIGKSESATPILSSTDPIPDVEVWYINMAKRSDRQMCMKKQLESMGLEAHRFEALEIAKEDLWPQGKYHDCVKGGMLKERSYVDKTSGGLSSGAKTKLAVIGDTCSHKRLFQQLAKSNSTAKYFLVLEDDAILHPEKLKPALKQFTQDYKGKFKEDWQMVQLDFVGSYCKGHAVGMAGGKKVFKPENIYTPGFDNTWKKAGDDCSRYYGSQALLMQKSQLNSVVEQMESMKTDAMDHVQGKLPRALAWRPQIAGSPIRAFSALPSYCKVDANGKSLNIGQSSINA